MTANVAWLAPDEEPSSQSSAKSSECPSDFSFSSPDGVVLVGAMLGLAVTSVRYAVWLNSPKGRKWDKQHTWFVTVIGVFLTLAWLAVHDPKAALKAFAFFVVSGTPIVVRSLSLESERLEAYINRETRSGDQF
jgi:hypothetical protein